MAPACNTSRSPKPLSSLDMESHFLNFLAVISLPVLLLLQFHYVEAKTGGFTVEIIHRDSPLSPLYNHSATPGDLARNDAIRSIARANHFRPQLNSSSLDGSKVESQVTPDIAEYFMKFSVGTPAVEVLAVMDTGSDLIWVEDGLVFNSQSSSTYTQLSCNSQPCQELPVQSQSCSNNLCGYTIYYLSAQSGGVLSTETLTFDSTNGQVAAFPNSVFGSGNPNGPFPGIVGLAGGPLSLISQLGTAQIEKKFSYCLLPRSVNSASKLKFGTEATISGPGVVSTPIQSDSSGYYLTLEAVTVGTKSIPFSGQTGTGTNGGNIVIDSGTTLNLLEPGFYNQLEAAVKEVLVGLNPINGQRGYSLCYDSSAFSGAPEITMVFHFTGADVTLTTLNIFRALDFGTCLAMIPSPYGLSLYGNWAQMNFQVEYDLVNQQVSFAPADCTQY